MASKSFDWRGIMDDESSLKTRDEIFGSKDAILYQHIGLFIAWFSAVELRLTMLLAMVTLSSNNERFELLVRGMDARVKLERLRRACQKWKPIGPNLAKRFDIFEKTSLPLRNKIAHSFLTIDDGYETLHLATISRLPYAAYGRDQQGEPPESMPLMEIFENGIWLSFLNKDLGAAMRRGFREETLEIDHPLTPLRPGEDHDSDQPKHPANPGKRERKRERKEQLRRGKPKSF